MFLELRIGRTVAWRRIADPVMALGRTLVGFIEVVEVVSFPTDVLTCWTSGECITIAGITSPAADAQCMVVM